MSSSVPFDALPTCCPRQPLFIGQQSTLADVDNIGQLAMATLGVMGAITFLSMGGKKAKEQGPPMNASSKEEEKFIK